MEELLKQVEKATTRVQKQELSAKLMSAMPKFLLELGELEQKYMKGLKISVDSEGSKSAGELLIGETDLHREYKYKKRLYDSINATIKVLNMYTGGG